MKTLTIILTCAVLTFAQQTNINKEIEKIEKQYRVAKICVISGLVATGILGLMVLRIEWDLTHIRRSLYKLEDKTAKLKHENDKIRKAMEGFAIKALLIENEEETK